MGANINIDSREKKQINLSMEVSALKANCDKLITLKALLNRL
jgi:hypothetical protein